MKQETPNQRLRLIRGLLQFNQTQFSKALGFKQSHISAVESEKKEVSVKIIYALVNKFKVSANWLLSGKGEMFLTPHDRVEYISQEPDTTQEYVVDEISSLISESQESSLTYALSETELLHKIKELEVAIIQEGYVPLHNLCDLYALLLELPVDYSILQKIPVPLTTDTPAGALSPILNGDFTTLDLNQKVAYFSELENTLKAWRTTFHIQFHKLYAYLTQPELYADELKSLRESGQHKNSD